MPDYLKEVNVNQEFIHVATPEENSFIEAYNSIMERELLQTGYSGQSRLNHSDFTIIR